MQPLQSNNLYLMRLRVRDCFRTGKVCQITADPAELKVGNDMFRGEGLGNVAKLISNLELLK